MNIFADKLNTTLQLDLVTDMSDLANGSVTPEAGVPTNPVMWGRIILILQITAACLFQLIAASTAVFCIYKSVCCIGLIKYIVICLNFRFCRVKPKHKRSRRRISLQKSNLPGRVENASLPF